MTTCAAKGCTARPAARGLCTRHLGLDSAGKKPARPGVVFVDKLPAPSMGGPTPHPVDVRAAQDLRAKPGEWGIYPIEEKWPDAGEIEHRTLVKRLYTMKTRIEQAPTGVWRDGRYEAVVRDSKLFIRYVGGEEAAA